MTEHAPEVRELPRGWPRLTLREKREKREKRVKLVGERLGSVVAEARGLGIGADELAATLRILYEEES